MVPISTRVGGHRVAGVYVEISALPIYKELSKLGIFLAICQRCDQLASTAQKIALTLFRFYS